MGETGSPERQPWGNYGGRRTGRGYPLPGGRSRYVSAAVGGEPRGATAGTVVEGARRAVLLYDALDVDARFGVRVLCGRRRQEPSFRRACERQHSGSRAGPACRYGTRAVRRIREPAGPAGRQPSPLRIYQRRLPLFVLHGAFRDWVLHANTDEWEGGGEEHEHQQRACERAEQETLHKSIRDPQGRIMPLGLLTVGPSLRSPVQSSGRPIGVGRKQATPASTAPHGAPPAATRSAVGVREAVTIWRPRTATIAFVRAGSGPPTARAGRLVAWNECAAG